MYRNIGFFFLFLGILGCSSFPYQDLIEESVRYIEANHPEGHSNLEIDGERWHFFRLANPTKPLLLLIHGSPGSWQAYAHFFKSPRLVENFELIAFDRFGYGKNRRGLPHGKLDDQIQIPLKLIENFAGSRPVIVVGHSYGGPVAVKLAQMYPKKVQALILLAAAVDPDLEETLWYQNIAKQWGIRSLIPSALDVCNREILALKDELKIMASSYGKINQPVFVVQGTIDKLVPKENVDYLKRKLKKEQLHITTLKEGRHFIPWAFPGQVEAAIVKASQFINSNGKSSSP